VICAQYLVVSSWYKYFKEDDKVGEIQSFKDLRIWQQGIEIVKIIYSMTKSFPKSELFGLTGQMRRASISIPSNIAEGQIKYHSKEFSRYLNIVLGSCAELETLCLISKELGYFSPDQLSEILKLIEIESKQVNTLRVKLREINS